MKEDEILCGRDVTIRIDGKKLLQAESAEIRRLSEIHAVRSCFVSDDMAHIRRKSSYKVNLTGIRFKKPFENMSFADLDNFMMEMELDGMKITLCGCMWDDFLAAADRNKFREHISAAALRMKTEEIDEGSGYSDE